MRLNQFYAPCEDTKKRPPYERAFRILEQVEIVARRFPFFRECKVVVEIFGHGDGCNDVRERICPENHIGIPFPEEEDRGQEHAEETQGRRNQRGPILAFCLQEENTDVIDRDDGKCRNDNAQCACALLDEHRIADKCRDEIS